MAFLNRNMANEALISLKIWFNMDYYDVSCVIDAIGFKGIEYTFAVEKVTNAAVILHIQTKTKGYLLKINRIPTRYWELVGEDGSKSTYNVGKKLVIEKIM